MVGMGAAIKVSQRPAEHLRIDWSRTTGLSSCTTATTISPLDRGEVNDPATDKNQQQGSQAGKELGIGEREFSQNSSTRRFGPGHQNLMLLSPWRPQTTMAIEKVKRAARDAHPAVISMALNSIAGPTLPRVVAAR